MCKFKFIMAEDCRNLHPGTTMLMNSHPSHDLKLNDVLHALLKVWLNDVSVWWQLLDMLELLNALMLANHMASSAISEDPKT